jgi:hypothetical protein
MDQGLVLAGLSALSDGTVMTYYDYQNCDEKIYNKCGELTMAAVFEKHHVYVDLSQPTTVAEVKTPVVIDTTTIFVKLLNEKTLTINVSTDGTVKELMDKIYEREYMPLQEQNLAFAGKQLDKPERKLYEYGLLSGSTVYVLPRLKGGAMNAYFTEDLDPQWDYDFTHVKDDNPKFVRGGLEYKRPCGWMRYGIRVLDRYDNNDWLGSNGNDKEWPVSYHGTNLKSAVHIVEDMYDVTKQQRAAYGTGIYSTPDVNFAAGYSVKFEYERDGRKDAYTIVLQNRVDRSAMSVHCDGRIFLVPNGQHIRPYGILIR